MEGAGLGGLYARIVTNVFLNILDTLPFNLVLVSMVRQNHGRVRIWHLCSVLSYATEAQSSWDSSGY